MNKEELERLVKTQVEVIAYLTTILKTVTEIAIHPMIITEGKNE